MSESNVLSAEMYIKALESNLRLNRQVIRAAVRELVLIDGDSILDLPCGIGNHAPLMLEENDNVTYTGVDFASDHIEYAKKKVRQKGFQDKCRFLQGDINAIEFDDNSFDLVWCCDGLWPGPAETGCLVEDPMPVLRKIKGMLKDGGRVAVLFWTSQKLLPGYPLIEAALNTTVAANRPFTRETDPLLHIMRTPQWLENAGFTNVQSKTFVADIQTPVTDESKRDIMMLFTMFWAGAEGEVSAEVWERYQSLTNPESDEYILDSGNYHGFLTYTMYTGDVENK